MTAATNRIISGEERTGNKAVSDLFLKNNKSRFRVYLWLRLPSDPKLIALLNRRRARARQHPAPPPYA
eukprot:SAG31_NODE_11875_length_989_cov_11.700000_2_plen_68_part_00